MKRAFSSKSDPEKKESKQIPDHQATERCQELKQKVVEASQKILASFLTDGGRSLDHPVLMRFWGSIDAICRASIESKTHIRGALVGDAF